MSSALAIDHARPPALPAEFRPPRDDQRQLKSPLPPDWSNATKPLRELIRQLDQLTGGDK
jgi:penicillin-binding protein 1A